MDNVGKTNLTWRDGYQSTIDARMPKNARPSPLQGLKLMQLSAKANFDNFEISGGQHFDNEIRAGRNPFNIMELQQKFFTDEDGTPTINPQMLFRGANVLGLTHFAPDVIEHFLNLYIDLGMKRIRSFDALNDIDNLTLPDSVKEKAATNKVNLQGALCYGHYPQAEHRYTKEYYVEYAKKLVEAGFNSIVIKDMSGQLDYDKSKALVKALKVALAKAGPDGAPIPVELHIHSTNEERSLEAIQAAREEGIDTIETVEGPLSGGSAHHSLEAIEDHNVKSGLPRFKTSVSNYGNLVNYSSQLFGEMAKGRVDHKLRDKDKEDLCAIGIPGGAMPFAVAALRNAERTIIKNNEAYFVNHIDKEGYKTADQVIAKLNDEAEARKSKESSSNSTPIWNATIELFKQELPRVCQDANYPPLVTPTADICYTQAIRNMAYGKGLTDTSGELIANPWDTSSNPAANDLTDYYQARYDWTKPDEPGGGTKYTYDPRFVKLILGYYGQMKSYGEAESAENGVHETTSGNYFRPCDAMVEFCSNIDSISTDAKQPVDPNSQIYQQKLNNGMEAMPEVRNQVAAFIEKHGYKALSFGSREQLEAMFALFPNQVQYFFDQAPSTSSFVGRNEARQEHDVFRNFSYVVQPLLDQVQAIIISGKESVLPEDNPLSVELKNLGSIAERMYEVYQNLDFVKAANKFVETVQPSVERFGAAAKGNMDAFADALAKVFIPDKDSFLSLTLTGLITKLRQTFDLDQRVHSFQEDGSIAVDEAKIERFKTEDNYIKAAYGQAQVQIHADLNNPQGYFDRLKSSLNQVKEEAKDGLKTVFV